MLKIQADAWNAGNLEAFMAGLHKVAFSKVCERRRRHLRLAGNIGPIQTTAIPTGAAMGLLTFSDLDTTLLSADAALVFGRWRLKTEQGEPNGLFTLLFRKGAGHWQIVADHTSAAKP